MPIGELIAAIGGTKAAIDTLSVVLKSGAALETADLKFKLLDAVNALTDAREALIAARDDLRERDEEVARLKEAMELRKNVVKRGSAYFEIGEDGKADGDPFCMHCWEDQGILRHLATPYHGAQPAHCHKCGAKYEGKVVMLEWLGR